MCVFKMQATQLMLDVNSRAIETSLYNMSLLLCSASDRVDEGVARARESSDRRRRRSSRVAGDHLYSQVTDRGSYESAVTLRRNDTYLVYNDAEDLESTDFYSEVSQKSDASNDVDEPSYQSLGRRRPVVSASFIQPAEAYDELRRIEDANVYVHPTSGNRG